MNNEMKFKTTINCGGCVAKVTPLLNETKGIENWNVETANNDKILTVTSNGVSSEEVIETIKKAGFKIEEIKNKPLS